MRAYSVRTVGLVAQRIEVAYLRFQDGSPADVMSIARVTRQAAQLLLEMSGRDRRIPVDPEFFVRAQVLGGSVSWASLIDPVAGQRYRELLRRAVGLLRRELAREVRYIEQQVQSGLSLDRCLHRTHHRTSPLGRYISARLHGRDDLADRERDDCRDQHQACPLYRLAFGHFLPDSDYPVSESLLLEPGGGTCARATSPCGMN